MNTDQTDAIETLQTAAIDASNGYATALEAAHGGRDMAPLFRSMQALHQSHARELSALLGAAGEDTDNDGSFMSYVHEAIMNLRALVGGLDSSVLPGLIDGEQRNVSSYEDALRTQPGPDARAVLVRQRDALLSAIRQMQSMKPE